MKSNRIGGDEKNANLQRLTADKMEIKDFPKPRQVGTSFIRKLLPNIVQSGTIMCNKTYQQNVG